jgi:hemoglobin-like flavoprotein
MVQHQQVVIELSDVAAMEQTLVAIADAEIDIAPALFDRFFAAFPEHRAAFYNLDAARARMTNETLEAIYGLASDEHWVATTVTNFVDLHRNYGTYSAELYAAFIDMTVDTLAEAVGLQWTGRSEAAWRAQATRLKTMIAAIC